MPRKSSFVFLFFDKKTYTAEEKTIKCSKCNKKVSYRMSCSTGSLRHHLIHEHNICSANYKKDKLWTNKVLIVEEENETNSDDNPESYTKDSHLIESLMDFLLCTDQAFSLVQNNDFIKFLKALNKNFKLPSVKTLVNTIIPNKVRNHSAFYHIIINPKSNKKG